MEQYVDWISNQTSVEEVPNINWIIKVFPGTKKKYSRTEPNTKLLVQPVKDMQPKYVIAIFPYPWLDGTQELSGSINIQIEFKEYQGVIHNTYHGGHIETDNHFIC